MLVELSVVEQSYHAVMEVLSGVPVVEVAERYGVSRQSGACLGGPLSRRRGPGCRGCARFMPTPRARRS